MINNCDPHVRIRLDVDLEVVPRALIMPDTPPEASHAE